MVDAVLHCAQTAGPSATLRSGRDDNSIGVGERLSFCETEVVDETCAHGPSSIERVFMTEKKLATRIEKDSLGHKEIPSHVYYGIQTARAVENFPISGLRAHRTLIRAIAMVKEAAALANRELGLIDDKTANAIVAAAKEVQEGKWDEHFPVDVFQAGAGVSFHMNSNEVIANRASELLGGAKGEYKHVHPNDHVNYGQSTNDVFPTAMRVATLLELEKLYPVLDGLAAALADKGKEFHHILKSGRTHMQDAVPMRLGQEFTAYGGAVERAKNRSGSSRTFCTRWGSVVLQSARALTRIPSIGRRRWKNCRASPGRSCARLTTCVTRCSRIWRCRASALLCGTWRWR